MLKNILFLCLLLTSHQAYAVQNSTTSLADIQHLIQQNNSTAALSSLQDLLKAEPENYQAWFLLGVTQAEQQQFDAAIHAFHQVVALQPKLAEPHNNLAVIYDEMGNIRAAVNELEASLVLKPGYVTAQENLGDLYVKLAADAYQKVLERSNNPALQRRYQRLLELPSNAASSASAITTAKTPPTIVAAAKKIALPPASTTEKPVSITEPKNIIAHIQTPAPSAVTDTPQQLVLKAFEAWRMAWSNKNTTTYFSAYSDDFQYGASYASLKKWRAYKTWAIQKRRFIKINIEQLVTTVISPTRIKLTFLQHFRSDSFNSDDHKEMLFKKTSNGWKIIYEASM
ncbi:MAG: tetratricopeptide repeat protein [Mariprofundus sp.]|nr:tetratricopeptide repeat protein [Mariprofundus sp.]